ncbi:MAG: hypothetical protein ACOCY0_04515 [Roseicyclus sp.]
MARHAPKWRPEIDEAPPSHPKTRDQLVQENRAKTAREPAADPRDAEGETGPGTDAAPEPRTRPARTYMVHNAEGDTYTEGGTHDVRAGPGDAGAADTPRHSTEPAPGRRDTWSRALGIIAVAAVIAILVALLF